MEDIAEAIGKLGLDVSLTIIVFLMREVAFVCHLTDNNTSNAFDESFSDLCFIYNVSLYLGEEKRK